MQGADKGKMQEFSYIVVARHSSRGEIFRRNHLVVASTSFKSLHMSYDCSKYDA